MSSLAPIRRIPIVSPEAGSVDTDIARLVEACRATGERDELIRSLHGRGVTVKRLTDITGLSHQRIYQVVAGTNGHQAPNRGGRNGNGSTGEPAG